MNLYASLRVALLSTLVLTLSGCTFSNSVAPLTSSTGTSAVQVSGRVHGGQQPVSGATIQLYTVGTSFDGSASAPLLTSTVVTDASGNFNITGLYSCSSASLVYIVATGGNPGLSSNNPNLAEMTALGACSSLTANTFVYINEVTTVAAVYALAPFMSSYTSIGSSTSDTAAIAAAFTQASQFANPGTGISPGVSAPAGTTVPASQINSLANSVSACINSAGGSFADSTTCGQLFAYTTPGSSLPATNTIASLLYLANNPTLNTTLLYNLAPSSPPFQPYLNTVPVDFRIIPTPSAPPSITVTPALLNFPQGTVGVTSTAQVAAIQNTGSSNVTLSGITLTGANAADFASTNNCPTTLAPSAACLVQVTITPSALGARIAYLTVASNSPASPQYVTLTVNNPVPAIASLNPSSLTAGSTSTSILVIGSNFVPSSVVQVGGSDRQTTYLASSEVIFTLNASDLAAAGHLAVTVVNAPPSGGTSAAATLTVAAAPSAPVISQTSPTQFTISSTPGSIAVFGNGFTSSCYITWNGTALSTSYVYSSYYGYYLYATVPANLIASSGSAVIGVTNPATTPSQSNTLNVPIVNPPAPTLTSLTPSSAPIRTATAITLYGSNFTTSSTAAFNGVTVPTTYVSSTTLTATLPASSVQIPGSGSFTVTTPAPGGGTTAALGFTTYIGIVNNSMVYNPVNGLFYVSVPSSVGPPYGNSVVSVDPASGILGTPIFVGSEPNKLAVTADGRYLWVGLDGASAVRKVDLVAGTAGLQFTLGGNGGIYDSPGTALALVALPNATDSVVVSTSSSNLGYGLAIYDSGVVRGSAINAYTSTFYGLQADGTRSEIYAAGSGYYTYTYGAGGLTLKASNTQNSYAGYNVDEIQITGGRLYTDYGHAYDPESGALLGSFYSSGSNFASGPTTADATLGRVYILDSPTGYGGTAQIQVFNVSDYNATSSNVIPVSYTTGSSSSSAAGPNRMTRWGANGLAFRTGAGIYSFRSNLVQDLSTTATDLAVTLTANPTAATGANSVYTATVTNNGPSGATSVVLASTLPASTQAVFVSAVPSTGFCGTTGLSCNIGSLASGASATVTYTLQQLNAGSSTISVAVTGSETDSAASNNQASATVTVTGGAYNLGPRLTAIVPSAIRAGSLDTPITLTGSNFNAGSTVLFNGSVINTTYVNSTTLTATVTAPNLLSIGWGGISVTTPAPGGGTSASLPLTVFQVLTVGVNHILYNPFDRKLYASVGSGSNTVTGNSIAAITPDTGAIGPQINVGSQPTKMAMSDDGNVMYVLLGGANSVASYNLKTQHTDFSFTPSITNYGSPTAGFRDVAVLPGSETVVAVDFGYTTGLGLFDVNPTAQTATMRGTGNGIYQGSSLQFLDNQNLLVFNSDTWQTLDKYPITAAGFGYNATHTSSTLLDFGYFKYRGGLAFSNGGGVANPTPTVAAQIGEYLPYNGSYGQIVEPDTSLASVFFLTATTANASYGVPDGIVSFNQNTFLPTTVLPLGLPAIEGNTAYSGVDLIRWGQDGLAVLTSGGHLYLMRGPFVVPQELNTNSAATLGSSSVTSATHGAGNSVITLTGANFVPGVAAMWNGSYRTTTVVDATHVTMAIPASDLAAAGSATITLVNPGATASSGLTFTIN